MDFGCLDLFYFLVNVWKGFMFYKCLYFRAKSSCIGLFLKFIVIKFFVLAVAFLS
jgi:hypothetical protein